MRIVSAWITLGTALLTACGGDVVVDTSGNGGGAGRTTGTTGTTEPSACSGLDFCGCSEMPGCEVVYGDCICACDYQCTGDPPCVCKCGGGPYFGCAPAACPGPFKFAETAMVSFDAEGCPFVSP